MLNNRRYIIQRIKSFGADLGFNEVGVASPDASVWENRYLGWLQDGLEGEMKYMAKDPEKRTNPQLLFPEVKSVIVASVNYYPGEWRRSILDDPLKGYIANYALNRDYHLFIESKLQLLLQHISQIAGRSVQGRIYVDTGPVQEKAFAVMAGLGWMGKQTLLVNEKSGTWTLLGVMLIDEDLEPAQPAGDQCGDCIRCIEACPTQAITAPYRLDARRCISYLVGELKGPIPVEMRPLIGNRIFGCDDCQWACPWNRESHVSDEPAFQPRMELAAPMLSNLAEMGDAHFKQVFHDSSIGRLRRRRYLRNIAVALGNSGRKEAVSALEKLVRDPDAMISEHAEWAVNRI